MQEWLGWVPRARWQTAGRGAASNGVLHGLGLRRASHLQPRVFTQEAVVLLHQLGLLQQQGLHLAGHLLCGERVIHPPASRVCCARLEGAVLLR
jgi:hypothetical protein